MCEFLRPRPTSLRPPTLRPGQKGSQRIRGEGIFAEQSFFFGELTNILI